MFKVTRDDPRASSDVLKVIRVILRKTRVVLRVTRGILKVIRVVPRVTQAHSQDFFSGGPIASEASKLRQGSVDAAPSGVKGRGPPVFFEK